jgi:hypothetical protein
MGRLAGAPRRVRGLIKWAAASVAAVVLVPLLVLVIAFVTWPYRSRHILGYRVQVNLPLDFSGCTRLTFNSPGAPRMRAEGPLYVIDLPADGVFRTSTDLLWGETLQVFFGAQTPGGLGRVTPVQRGGGTTTYPNGSVEIGTSCFSQPLQFVRD